MGFAIGKKISFLLCLMVLLPAFCSASQFTPSRATYYGAVTNYGTPSGASGFGEFERALNDGTVPGVSKLYRNGFEYGACYQVRCTNLQICHSKGVTVVVTDCDCAEGDRADFILSARAFEKMSYGYHGERVVCSWSS